VSWLSWLEAPRSDTGIHLITTSGPPERVGYDRLAELAKAWAGSVTWRDVGRRDGVLLVAPPSAALMAAFFGLLSAGADVGLIAPPSAMADRDAYRAHLRAALDAVAPRLVLCPPGVLATMRAAMDVGEETILAPLPADGRPDAEVMAAVRLARGPGPGDLLQLTSGSSGAARCVQVAPAAVAHNVTAIASWLNVLRGDALASWLPLYHDMGLIGCFLTPIERQADVYLTEPWRFVRRPEAFLSLFQPGGATITAMPPFGLELIIRRVEGGGLAGLDLSGWRSLIVGAERIPAGLFERFADLLAPAGFRPEALCPAYGLAEGTLAVTGSPPGEAPRARPRGPGEATSHVSCGRPLPGIRVSIVDAAGQEATEGSVGEIVVDSPSLARGYRGTPSRSARFASGRLWTGDAGFLLDGELYVVGRMGDAVKVRGKWLFAEDLEDRLDGPSVRDGRAVVVVGQVGGEVEVLVFHDRSAVLDTAGLVRHLRTENMPATVTLVPAGRREIPRTTSGKPRRRELWLRHARGRPTPGAAR
jgi:acyl-CoA synthetase (AMP-forming)/AMP-acid ligase II